jgi:cytochrome c oxidase subunit 1
MPRRVYTYPPVPGWFELNLLASIGAYLLGVGVLVFLWNLLSSLHHGAAAGNDPWDAWTLEWSTTSPPPEHNFTQIPAVYSRRPLWDLKHPEAPDWKQAHG